MGNLKVAVKGASSPIQSTADFMNQEHQRVNDFYDRQDARKKPAAPLRFSGGQGSLSDPMTMGALSGLMAGNAPEGAAGLVGAFLDTAGNFGRAGGALAAIRREHRITGALDAMREIEQRNSGLDYKAKVAALEQVLHPKGPTVKAGMAFGAPSKGARRSDVEYAKAMQGLDEDRAYKKRILEAILEQLSGSGSRSSKEETADQWVNNAGHWLKRPVKRELRETESYSQRMSALAPLLSFLTDSKYIPSSIKYR